MVLLQVHVHIKWQESNVAMPPCRPKKNVERYRKRLANYLLSAQTFIQKTTEGDTKTPAPRCTHCLIVSRSCDKDMIPLWLPPRNTASCVHLHCRTILKPTSATSTSIFQISKAAFSLQLNGLIYCVN